MKNSRAALLIMIAVVVAVAGAWSYITYVVPAPPAIDGIPCGLESTVMHIHAHLDIFINGQTYTIPAGTGIIDSKCLYWMHTHDVTGVIHVESPVQADYTLGEFFDIWGKAFNDTQILDYGISTANPLAIYVNGVPVGDYRNIIFHEHDEIAIVYGIPPGKIPSSYAFAPGL